MNERAMPLPVVVIPAVPPRSPIPKVVGILAIVFAGLGLVTSLTLTLGFEKEFRRFGITKHDLGSFGTWMNVSMLPALAVFALHLTGGIMSLKYMPRSRTVTNAYAVLALVVIVVDIVITVVTFPSGPSPIFDEIAGPRIGLALMASPWPIVVLVLMNLSSARRSVAAGDSREAGYSASPLAPQIGYLERSEAST